MSDTRQIQGRKQSRSRSRSRPRRDSAPLHRLLSSQFPDDHSVYHHEDGEGLHVDTDARSLHKTETERRETEPSGSDDEDSLNGVDEIDTTSEKKDEAAHEDETTYEEIRSGVPYEHDIEASASPLEKEVASAKSAKSTKSVKSAKSAGDPNLVSTLLVNTI